MLTEKTQSIFYPKEKSYIFKLLILRKQIISSWDEYFTRIVVSLLIVFNKSVSVVDSCEYFYTVLFSFGRRTLYQDIKRYTN